MTVCFGFYRSTFSSFCNIDVNFLNIFSINNQVFIFILTFKSVLITFDNFCCFFSTASFFICVAALLATSFSTVSSKSSWIYIKTEEKPLKSKVIPMLWNMRRKKHLQIMTMFLILRFQPFKIKNTILNSIIKLFWAEESLKVLKVPWVEAHDIYEEEHNT